jgi:ABC-2 type transport system permease protein
VPDTLRLAFVHARVQVAELVRFPGFTAGTLAFPAVVFVLFGLPRAGTHPELLLASYCAFAVLGVGFFQFGVSGAIERGSPWQAWLRTLPTPPAARVASRILSALAFTSASIGLVVVLSLTTTNVSLSPSEWIRLALALLAGSVPFVLLGLTIAYWSSPKSALPLANILYMLLAYAGGLWTGPSDLPRVVREISPYTPARQWADVLWPAVTGQPWRASHWLLLAVYSVAFGALAAWGLARDELRNYR